MLGCMRSRVHSQNAPVRRCWGEVPLCREGCGGCAAASARCTRVESACGARTPWRHLAAGCAGPVNARHGDRGTCDVGGPAPAALQRLRFQGWPCMVLGATCAPAGPRVAQQRASSACSAFCPVPTSPCRLPVPRISAHGAGAAASQHKAGPQGDAADKVSCKIQCCMAGHAGL